MVKRLINITKTAAVAIIKHILQNSRLLCTCTMNITLQTRKQNFSNLKDLSC